MHVLMDVALTNVREHTAPFPFGVLSSDMSDNLAPASSVSGDEAFSAAAFHKALCSVSSAYERYSTLRKELWADDTFQGPRAVLGQSDDYANHYRKSLLPILVEGLEPSSHRTFLDLGCAPGGLCKFLLQLWPEDKGSWTGVGVTLSPDIGGLAMQVEDDARLRICYADVVQHTAFVDACVTATSTIGGEKAAFDFVNLGIVLDHTVRVKRQRDAEGAASHVSYGEQLFTQLTAAKNVLRSDGKGVLMLAMKTDFPSLPEVLPSLRRLQAASREVRLIPTMYTESTGKKQFYVVAVGCLVTDALCDDLRRIWNLGTQRYLAMKRQAIEAKRTAGMALGVKGQRLQHLPAVVVENNGYASEETVRDVYTNPEGTQTVLGSDLDHFFTLVHSALSRA